MSSGLSAASQTFRSSAAERTAGRIGNVFNANAECCHQFLDEAQRVRSYRGIRYGLPILESDGVALGKTLPQLAKHFFIPKEYKWLKKVLQKQVYYNSSLPVLSEPNHLVNDALEG